MPNGSLHSSKSGLLDWPMRYKIAMDAAEELSYLHHDCAPPIVHRDVKSNNILLDGEFTSVLQRRSMPMLRQSSLCLLLQGLVVTLLQGCPEEFVSKNREALESEYAANIFYYLTCEYAVDLDTMDDELQRSAIEDQIANFDQTPIQLFWKKYPRRGPPIPIVHPLRFAASSINLTSMASCASSCPSATLYVNVLDSNIVLVNQCLSMSVKTWVTTQLQSGGNFTFAQGPFFRIGFDILPPRKIGSPLAENIELGAQCFGALSTPSEFFLITCGTCENSFQVISLTDGRMVQSIRQH